MTKSLLFDAFYEAIRSGEPSEGLRNSLRESLFYYCSGKDPTPIVGMYSDFPIFIYADKMRYGRGCLHEEALKLEKRLCAHGFKKERREEIDFCEGALLYAFSKDSYRFLLLFVKGDAWKTYREIYEKYADIIPRCIANYRYEMDARHFLSVERRAELILGHSNDGEHHPIKKLNYYGDYSGKYVTLYGRG